MGLKICKNSSLMINGFSDADWAGSLDDRRSTGVYAFLLALILYHGVLGSKPQFQGQAQRQNIRL